MRENRTCGSEGGEAQSLPYPYRPATLPSAGRRSAPAACRVLIGATICCAECGWLALQVAEFACLGDGYLLG